MANGEMMDIEVVYASPHQSFRHFCELKSGSLVKEALASFLEVHPHISKILNTQPHEFGLWSEKCTKETVLTPGDRLEIYHPIQCDPKKIRRRQVKKK